MGEAETQVCEGCLEVDSREAYRSRLDFYWHVVDGRSLSSSRSFNPPRVASFGVRPLGSAEPRTMATFTSRGTMATFTTRTIAAGS